jgi:hypothetical protein
LKRIKHNDLTHYFLRQHSELPPAYLASCQEFFKELGNERQQQAPSCKQQAAKKSCAELEPVLKTDSTERYNYENK